MFDLGDLLAVILLGMGLLEVEGEREEKEEKKRNCKKRIKKEYLNKMGKKIELLGCWVYCKMIWYN